MKLIAKTIQRHQRRNYRKYKFKNKSNLGIYCDLKEQGSQTYSKK